jgi:hypothetical protein
MIIIKSGPALRLNRRRSSASDEIHQLSPLQFWA